VHGLAVCALALRVDDATRAAERALTLLDQPFQQPVGPSELNIPAVRGLGGSLLYFVRPCARARRLWDVDFAPVAGDVAEGGSGDDRSHIAIHALRGDAHLASVLSVAVSMCGNVRCNR